MLKSIKYVLSVSCLSIIAACGGEGDTLWEFSDTTSYDETATAVEIWEPKTTTQAVNNVPTEFYLFPLGIHQRAILKSYVSKVGTTSTSNYRLNGTMTTPTVAAGNYVASYIGTRSYGPSQSFEGASATPVVLDAKTFNVTLNGQSLPDSNSLIATFYDTTYGIKLGWVSLSSKAYSVIDINRTSRLPDFVVTGDAGNYLVYANYSDSTKTTSTGATVLSYKVLSVAAVTSEKFKARVEWKNQTYSQQNVLLGVSTVVEDLTYSVSTGATVQTVSNVHDDVAGSVVSHINWTRI